MGMYDQIICKMKLPDNPPSFVTDEYEFQFKDFECELNTYVIESDGTIKGAEDYTGTINFYNSNRSTIAYGFEFTRKGEDFESVDYLAKVVDGKVIEIQELEKERKPTISSEELRQIEKEAENPKVEIDITEPEIGNKMFLQYGGGIEGFEVTVGLKTPYEWAVFDERGRIIKLHPIDLGRLLFHSKEDSERLKQKQKETMALVAEKVKAAIQSKISQQEKLTNG